MNERELLDRTERTLTQRMKLVENKERTPQQAAVQLERVAGALARRAVRSGGVIKQANTQGDSIRSAGSPNSMVIHENRGSTASWSPFVSRYFETRKESEDPTLQVTKLEKRQEYPFAGKERVKEVRVKTIKDPVSGEVMHGEVEGAKSSEPDLERSDIPMTQNESLKVATLMARQTRQEIAAREKQAEV